jgi:predicted nucleic acid-binding protein
VTLCVLDASVALSWAFKDETSPYAEPVIETLKRRRAVVTPIWPMEINNALLSAIRRARIDEPVALRMLRALGRLPLEVDPEIAGETLGRSLLRIGLDHNLSAYDASYLELAIRRELPLATQDERLARAARAAGVNILQA